MYNCCCMLLLSSHEFWDLISQGLTRGKKNAIRDRQSLVNNLLLLCNPKKCVGALLYVDNIHDNPSIYYVILVTTPSPQLFCKQEQDGWASGYGCKLLTIGYSACAARVTVVVLCVYVCLLQRNQRNAVSDVKVKVWTQYKLNNLHFRLNFFYKTAFLPRNSHVTICIVLSELPFVAHTYQLWRTWSATLSFCHSNVSIYNVWLGLLLSITHFLLKFEQCTIILIVSSWQCTTLTHAPRVMHRGALIHVVFVANIITNVLFPVPGLYLIIVCPMTDLMTFRVIKSHKL